MGGNEWFWMWCGNFCFLILCLVYLIIEIIFVVIVFCVFLLIIILFGLISSMFGVIKLFFVLGIVVGWFFWLRWVIMEKVVLRLMLIVGNGKFVMLMMGLFCVGIGFLFFELRIIVGWLGVFLSGWSVIGLVLFGDIVDLLGGVFILIVSFCGLKVLVLELFLLRIENLIDFVKWKFVLLLYFVNVWIILFVFCGWLFGFFVIIVWRIKLIFLGRFGVCL